MLFARAKPADPAHPYLVRKAVGVHGIRQLGTSLVIPLADPKDGKIHNLQFISPEGQKRPLSGARKTGLSHMLGHAVDGEPFALAEGYSTAATVHEAIRMPVAMTIDSGNMGPAAKSLREKYMSSTVIIAGDQDWTLPARGLPNVGREKAEAAAKEINARVILPPTEDGISDFNDLAARHGKAAVKSALEQRDAQAPAAATVPRRKSGPRMGM